MTTKIIMSPQHTSAPVGFIILSQEEIDEIKAMAAELKAVLEEAKKTNNSEKESLQAKIEELEKHISALNEQIFQLLLEKEQREKEDKDK